tara:strand:- start:117 stop:1160 length:1044 start_codon:yes stop_codon:yes gene_type:complete
MAYTTINKSSDYFNNKIWTGTGSENAQTGVGFQPDFTWIKRREVNSHRLFDAVRGATKLLESDTTAAETTDAQELKSFDSDGFTLGTGTKVNASGGTYASWNWKAGTTSGIATNGSTVITPSAYSFNQTSGFSVVKYTGNGNTTTKVAHGLGSVPKMLIIKKTSAGGDNWKVYHVSVGNTTALQLDNTGATAGGSDNFYDTTPDTVNFTLGNHTSVNANGATYVAYCFAEKTGFSKFGSYTGNGNADGAYVYTGFKPAFVLIKSSTTAMYWHIFDDERLGYNPYNYRLNPNASEAETTTTNHVDIMSNGFKIRTDQQQFGTNGATYIYMAFAEAPLVGTNNIPATAR